MWCSGRTKYVALSPLTPDYLNTTGAITVLEGETLNGDSLLAALGDTLRGAGSWGAAAGSRFLWDAGTGNGANTTATPDVYTAWAHPFAAGGLGLVTFPTSFEPTVDWRDRFWQYNITHPLAPFLCLQRHNLRTSDSRIKPDSNFVCPKPIDATCAPLDIYNAQRFAGCCNETELVPLAEVEVICRTLDFRNFRDRKNSSTCPNMHHRSRIILGNCTRVLWDITHTANASVPDAEWRSSYAAFAAKAFAEAPPKEAAARAAWVANRPAQLARILETLNFQPTPYSQAIDVETDKFGGKHAFEFVPTADYEDCVSRHADMLRKYDACLQGLVPDLNQIDEWFVKDRECIGGGGKCGPPDFFDFQAPARAYGFPFFNSSEKEGEFPTWPTPRGDFDAFESGMREPDAPFLKPFPPAADALRSYYGVNPDKGPQLARPPNLFPPFKPYADFPADPRDDVEGLPRIPTAGSFYIDREKYRGDRARPPRRLLEVREEAAAEEAPRSQVLEAARGSKGTGDDEPLSPQEQALHRAWMEKEGALGGGGA